MKPCLECNTPFEPTHFNQRICTPECYRRRRTNDQNARNNSRPVKGRAFDVDRAPRIDWVMERQFPTFFELVRVRYRKPEDVRKAIGHRGEKWN